MLSLLPLLFTRNYSVLGYFSGFVLAFTAVGILIVLSINLDIAGRSIPEAQEKYPGLEITEQDREFNYIDPIMIPIFISVHMNVFEGTQEVLNLYSETEDPKSFYPLIVGIFISTIFCLSLGFSYAAYFAYGMGVK